MLTYGSVNLWKLEKQDLGDHYRWANNDTLRRLAGGPPQPKASYEVEAWFQTVVKDPSQEIYSIKTAEAELLGWVQLSQIDLICGRAEVGVVLDEEAWGRGVASDALVAALTYCFEELRLHRVEAQILSINLPSTKLFTRLGFQKEGVRREAFFSSGRHLDVDLYGLLARDFVSPDSPSPV